MPRKVVWKWDPATIWKRHCSFLELSLKEFQSIQTDRLLRHLRDLPAWPMVRRLLPSRVPTSLEEFRRSVPLTNPADYDSLLHCDYAHASSSTAYRRVRACSPSPSGRGDAYVPYTTAAWAATANSLVAALILACACRKGEVRLSHVSSVLCCSPHRDSLFSLLAADLKQHSSLVSGVSTMAKASQEVHPNSEAPATLEEWMQVFPKRHWWEQGPWPRGLGEPRTIVRCGAAHSLTEDDIQGCWGQRPYQVYASAEGGIMALQGWNKRGMTLVPDSNLFEFVPEEESRTSRSDPAHLPPTLLLNELEPGRSYELAITSFHGMPFFRYRTGQLMRVVALEDTELGSRLPQVLVEGRCDDRLELNSGSLLSESTIWRALGDPQLGCVDWVVRTEAWEGRLGVHLYAEFRGELTANEITQLVEHRLVAALGEGQDRGNPLADWGLRVTCLPQGAFERCRLRRAMGEFSGGPAPLARVNASCGAVADLRQAGHTPVPESFLPIRPW